jgi:starch synthase
VSVSLKILMIASEAVPFSKTGGLGDVAGALPAALARLGHRVTLVVPFYRGSADGAEIGRLNLTLGPRRFEAVLREQSITDGAQAILLDCPPLYDRDAIYGEYEDNAVRFAFLSRAALEAAIHFGARPSIVHAHDWQAGLAPVYLKTRYRDHPVIGGVPTVFTIHNIAYQGLFSPNWLPAIDLGLDIYSPDGLEYWARISFLKGGIYYSEALTTVSRKYAEEIQTPELSFGFDGIVRRRAADLVGITNGIDQEQWNPARDRFLPEPYDATDLSGKRVAKREVLRELGLPADGSDLGRPLVAMISRLAYQKGLDLFEQIADRLMKLDATYVVLGSGERRYEDFWREMARRNPARVGTRIGFDERLAHLIEAGADIFVMPSRYEPCGLNQMYSLRYGTIPVVRATGGLDDTVTDYSGPGSRGTGFKFVEFSGTALIQALTRALDAYRQPNVWRALQLEGMRQNHSWDASALEYVKVYERVIQRASPGMAPIG